MGETADLTLDGILCEQCGVYIGEAIGYPRNCQDCQPKRRRRKDKKKAFASFAHGYAGRDSAWGGITNYLEVNYQIDVHKKGNLKRTKSLIRRFLATHHLAKKERNTYRATWYNANMIQSYFQDFTHWLKEQDLHDFLN